MGEREQEWGGEKREGRRESRSREERRERGGRILTSCDAIHMLLSDNENLPTRVSPCQLLS